MTESQKRTKRFVGIAAIILGGILSIQGLLAFNAGDSRIGWLCLAFGGAMVLVGILCLVWNPNMSRHQGAILAFALAAYSAARIIHDELWIPWSIIPIGLFYWAIQDFRSYTADRNEIEAGDIFTLLESGQFRVAKALAELDDGTMILRLYANRSIHRPRSVDLGLLELEESASQPQIFSLADGQLQWYDPEIVARGSTTAADAAAVNWFLQQSAAPPQQAAQY